MDTSAIRIGLVAMAALVGGGGIGWWLRGRYNWSRRVIMDELWTRKIRSYETTTEQALADKTIAASAQRGAEENLLAEQNRSNHLEEIAGGLQQQHQERLTEIAGQQDQIEKLESMAAEIDQALRDERQGRSEDRRKLEVMQKRIKSLHPFPGRLDECEAELARVEAHLTATVEEKNEQIARLTDWIAELTPLPETLRRRSDELASLRLEEGLAREKAASQAQLRETLAAELDELHQRTSVAETSSAELHAELEEKNGQIASLRQESIQRNIRITEHEVRLGQSQTAIDGLKSALTAKEKELEKSRRRTARAEDQKGRKTEQLATQKTQLSALREERNHSRKEQREAQRGLSRRTKELERLQRDAKPPKPKSSRASSPGAKAPSGAKKPGKRKTRASSASSSATSAELVPKGSARKKRASLPQDDLTAIRGVGAKVAQRLAHAGIRSYTQLAGLKDTRLAECAERIGVPLKRIKREGWIKSAAKLS